MQLLFDPVTLVNLILCIVIVILSIIGYVKIRSQTPLFIGAGFFLFGVSHVATLIGLKTALEPEMIIVRAIGYIAVCVGVYLIIREIMLRIKIEEELKREQHGLERRVEERTVKFQASNKELIASDAKLRESETSYRGLFNTIGQAIYILDPEGKFIDVNNGAEVMYGYAREEFMGKTPEFLSAPGKNDFAAVVEKIRTAFAGEPQEFEFWGLRKNKEIFPKDVRLYKGVYFGRDVIIAIGTDITGRKRAEETLMRVNQKLNVLSQLTRQDLTTQIFILNSYLEMAKKQATGQEGIIRNIESGELAARSIKEITEFTKDYQNMGEKPPKWQNLKLAILFGLSHISIGEIRHSVETENLEIFADPLLEKALQGLFENSLAHGGHVSRIRVWHWIIPDGVTIVFEDDGTGIPHEKKERIFLQGEGARASVRGLFFVREILDITGITIKETGEPGKGARFEMTVPKGSYRNYQDTHDGKEDRP